MEDFARELKSGSALFLLYGEPQIGKTRLLQELMQNRLADTQVHWVELAKFEGDDTPVDRSGEIEAVFESARPGDIIVADHFEEALQKPRHQLFLSWSTDGLDKNLNLILVSSTEGFNELRQLSMQYQVRVQSFQQMPYSQDEVEAFLGFYLFPDHPIGQLSIPSPLRKQLAATNGVVGQVLELAQREGKQIDSSPMAETESIRRGSWIMVTVLSVVAIVAGVVWYLNSSPVDEEIALGEAQTATVVLADEPAVTTTTNLPDSDSDVTMEAQQSSQPIVKVDSVSEAESQPAVEVEPEPEVENAPTVVESSGNKMVVQADEVPPDAIVVDESVPVFLSRFETELDQSLSWLQNSSESNGTVQIMSLGFDNFDETAYYRYIDGLKSYQVDTDQIRIFKTMIGSRMVYSVVYGAYLSRLDAAEAIDVLPAVLRKSAPIPRSVGGIRNEIRRLSAEN